MFVSTNHSDTVGIRKLTDGELDHVAGGAGVLGGVGTVVNDLLGTVDATVFSLTAGLGKTVDDLLGSL